MTLDRTTTYAAWACLAGSMAWLLKLGVIAATDGRVTSTGAAAVFFVAGVVLLAAGASWVGALVTNGRTRALRVALMAGSPVLFFASFVLLDGLAGGAAGDAGPGWFADEAGILATAVAWLAATVGVLRAGARP